MKKTKHLPIRSDVPIEDTWDLSSLFTSDEAWESAFKEWEGRIPGYERFRGTLGSSADKLRECLDFDVEVDRMGERVGTYAYLRSTEDTGNAAYQGMKAQYLGAASRAAQLASYIRPEILAIPGETMNEFLESKALAPYRIALERIVRYRPHTLNESEERLLAMQIEMAQAAGQAFNVLTNADMKFGMVKNEGAIRSN